MPSKLGSILITGGSGFLGSHLARRLADAGEEVHVFARHGSSLHRLEGLLERLTIWRGNLNDRQSIHDCLLACRPRVIFHLAGDTSVRRLDFAFQNVERSFDSLHGTMHLIEELRRARLPVRCLVRAGGLEEYGCGPYPYCETQRESPVSPYSAAQVATTHYCQMVQPALAFPVVTLRLALVYGPAQSASFFIPSLIAHFLENLDFSMTTGDQGRDLLFVEDVIDAFLAVPETEGLGREIINIGSGHEYRMDNVAELIRLLSGTSGRVQLGAVAGRSSEISHLVCRNEKAHRLLAWQPRTKLEDGLAQTIRWHWKAGAGSETRWSDERKTAGA